MNVNIEKWRWVALSLKPGNGCQKFRTWLTTYSNPDEWFKNLPSVNDPLCENARAVVQQCMDLGIELVTWSDPYYPMWLRQSKWALPLLYFKGTLPCNVRIPVALVGTRTPSWNGVANTKELVRQLKDYQCIVVSGLANGIDCHAHTQALIEGVTTWAVLAQGLDVNIPYDRGSIAKEILKQNGALISPFPPGSTAHKGCFIARNTTIAGLCKACVIIETRDHGGAMHTADNCLQDQRILLAVPGDFMRSTTMGCHTLLDSGSALPIWYPEKFPDLCELPLKKESLDITNPSAEGLYEIFHGESCSFIEIMDRTQWPPQELKQFMGILEISGKVIALGGENYQFKRKVSHNLQRNT